MDTEQKKEINLKRTYNVPVGKVWSAFTDENKVPMWWGPQGVTIPVCEIDPTPGGRIHIVMKGGPELGEAEGQEWPMEGTFDEVVENTSLVFSNESSQDLNGTKTVIAAKTSVKFKEENGKTTVTVNIIFTKISDTPQAQYSVQGMEYGWLQQMEKLEGFLQK